MKFKAYNKGESKEALMTFDADSLEKAINYASQIKKMDVDKFLKLFVVKEIK